MKKSQKNPRGWAVHFCEIWWFCSVAKKTKKVLILPLKVILVYIKSLNDIKVIPFEGWLNSV